MISEENKLKIKEIAKQFYSEEKSKEDFIKECAFLENELKSGDEMTPDEEEEAAKLLESLWSDALIEFENNKVGKVVSSFLSVLAEKNTVVHFKGRQSMLDYINDLTASAIAVLTDSGLKSEDCAKVLDAAAGKVKSVADEVAKSIKVYGDAAVKKSLGKELGKFTLKELADSVKE